MAKQIFNTFMCPKCGNRIMELPRPVGHQHKDGHRKKLYCFICKEEVNSVECKDDEAIFNFKLMFEEGEFKNE